jgi:hypothetical protein
LSRPSQLSASSAIDAGFSAELVAQDFDAAESTPENSADSNRARLNPREKLSHRLPEGRRELLK